MLAVVLLLVAAEPIVAAEPVVAADAGEATAVEHELGETRSDGSGRLLTATTAEPVATPRVIAERALPAVLEGGLSWRDEKGCLSCHRGAVAAWAVRSAMAADLQFDRDRGRELLSWTDDWTSLLAPEKRTDADQQDTLRRESDAVAQLLLSRLNRSEDVAALRAAMQPDGTWKAGGQLPLQDRPAGETTDVSTAWVRYALGVATESNAAETVAASPPHGVLPRRDPTTTEWVAVHLLLAASRPPSDPDADAARLVEQLLELQADDGGWPWKIGRASDALGTGIAMYALVQAVDSSAGEGRADEIEAALAAAVAFLDRTQTAIGGWRVAGTKRSARGRVTETASYWGTSWAVIALLAVDDQRESRSAVDR